MCHARWTQRRAEQDEQSREVWLDFERTTPVAQPEQPVEPPDVTRVEAPEEIATADR
jgi:hypothetical protein